MGSVTYRSVDAAAAGRGRRPATALVAAIVMTTSGCGAILGVDFGGAVLDGGEGDASPEADSLCKRAPLAPGSFGPGALCGAGACRETLSGTCPKGSADDAGTPTVCGAAFGAETCNGMDDNCNGVIDEGCAGVAGPAGFECKTCAFGHKVKRQTDGTIVGVTGSFQDDANSADCVSSDLCPIPGPSWVRHASGAHVSCTAFCKSIGATCQSACTIEQPLCDPRAASVNQGNMKFGTYAQDYQCMEASKNPTTGALVLKSTPDTGNCDFQIPDFGIGPQPTSTFNVYCCCAF